MNVLIKSAWGSDESTKACFPFLHANAFAEAGHQVRIFLLGEAVNLIGNPGAVVPVSQSPEGLPIGVQIVGRPWEEELVLAVAAEVERECGAWRRPPIS